MNDRLQNNFEERELVDSLKKGDDSALETIIDMYNRKVYSLAYNFLGNHQDAEDIVQMVFIKVFQKIKGFKGKSSFSTWLHRITINCCKDFLKAKYRSHTYYLEDLNPDDKKNVDNLTPSNQPLPSDYLQDKELNEIINSALDNLSLEHREIIIMREREGLSYEEISKILDCNLGTVMSRLFNARKKLAEILKKKIR